MVRSGGLEPPKYMTMSVSISPWPYRPGALPFAHDRLVIIQFLKKYVNFTYRIDRQLLNNIEFLDHNEQIFHNLDQF